MQPHPHDFVYVKKATYPGDEVEFNVQSTFDISTTLYLELFDISNFFPGPLDILQSLRLKSSGYLEPRYPELFGISNNISGPMADFLSLSRIFPQTFRNSGRDFCIFECFDNIPFFKIRIFEKYSFERLIDCLY